MAGLVQGHPGCIRGSLPRCLRRQARVVTSTAWSAIEQAVAGIPGAAFYPDYQIPALLHLGDKTILATIRARDPELDTRLNVSRYVQAGRALNEVDNGQLNALVDGFRLNIDAPVASTFAYDRFNGDWAFLDRGWPMVVPEPAPATSTAISVELPRVATADGQTAFDYSSPIPLSLNVVGQYRINTGDWDWTKPQTSSPRIRAERKRRPTHTRPVRPRAGRVDLTSDLRHRGYVPSTGGPGGMERARTRGRGYSLG